MPPENFIEVSFEVANKVGGIYQVLKSKTATMQRYYGGNYLTIGFYDEESARQDFAPREDSRFEKVFDRLEDGLEFHYGVWRAPKQPGCILVDVSNWDRDVDDIKRELYEDYGIDSMGASHDFDEPVKWSYAVGLLLDELKKEFEGETVAQFHEWMSGVAMLESSVPGVFTTHATFLGRVLSNSEFDLQAAIRGGEVDQSLAGEYGVKAKHQMEKTAAREAEVFTTVSRATGREAEAVLGVKPDKILPNGFNIEDFPNLEDMIYQHMEYKEEVKQFLQAFFQVYYDVDLENDPRILYTSGRYEFHNKGFDLLIDALSEVNRTEGDDFFFFILVPADIKHEKMEVLENMSLAQEVNQHVERANPEIKTRLLAALASGDDILEEMADLAEDPELKSLKRSFESRSGQKPPISAFDLNYANDEILDALWKKGLRNREGDRVKVVFYPTYLSAGDRLLSMEYQDFVRASSAGVFPSSYEPWGYTPVETAASGSLAVTTDMAGFGQFLLDNTDVGDRKGIYVLEREDGEYGEAVEDLADIIESIVSYSKTEIAERKHNARKLAQLTSWERLGENYREAHEMAVESA